MIHTIAFNSSFFVIYVSYIIITYLITIIYRMYKGKYHLWTTRYAISLATVEVRLRRLLVFD